METTSECIVCSCETKCKKYTSEEVLVCETCMWDLYEEELALFTIGDYKPSQEEEEVELQGLIEEWCSGELEEDTLDLYYHFDIPSNMTQSQQDALLEAAIDNY